MIIPEENAEPVCEVERVKGVRLDNGVATSMVFNDYEKHRLYVKKAMIFLTNNTLEKFPQSLEDSINALVTTGQREFVIMAKAFSSDVVRAFMNVTNGDTGVKLYPMQAPYINQREIMKDLEATLGGRYIHDEGAELDSITPEDFGIADIVIGEQFTSQFVGQSTHETEERVKARVEVLKKELKGEPSKFQKKALETRIAQLENGFALLKIGSTSDTDRKYLFDKAEDAVNTVRSAFQEGTVPGAGLSYKQISEEFDDDSILKKALLAPHKQIMENAGGEFEVDDWVRNSAKVDRVALENACRVASTLVTVGGVVVQEKPPTLDSLLNKK